MDAVAAVVDSFPVFSREAEGTTQQQAYLAQLFALFDALWGAADKTYDFIAVLEVRSTTRSAPHLPFIQHVDAAHDFIWHSDFATLRSQRLCADIALLLLVSCV